MHFSAFYGILKNTNILEVSPMDKLSMEELGYFLYMQEMERQQQAEQAGNEDPDEEEDDE